jgi:hypothetical protein
MMESKLFPALMLAAGWLIGTAEEPSIGTADAEPSQLIKYEAAPQCPACDCDYDEQIASLEARVAALEDAAEVAATDPTPAREATPESSGTIETATTDAAPAGFSTNPGEVIVSVSEPIVTSRRVLSSQVVYSGPQPAASSNAVEFKIVCDGNQCYRVPVGQSSPQVRYSQSKRQGLFRRIFSR